jgi:FXSXX-COOH protein
MQHGPEGYTTDLLDLGELSLEEILDGGSPALAGAAHRVLRALAGEEAPVAAYDSGGDNGGFLFGGAGSPEA